MEPYSKRGGCSLADRIALRRVGLRLELELLDVDAMKAPAYLPLNPAGKVAALQMED